MDIEYDEMKQKTDAYSDISQLNVILRSLKEKLNAMTDKKCICDSVTVLFLII